MKPAKLLVAAASVVVASIALSFVHPWGNPRTASSPDSAILEGAQVPDEVHSLIDTKCADCHSLKTRWPIYSRLAPGSWLIERDIVEARKRLNLSTWQQYDTDTQINLLSRIGSEARSGTMPVKQYLFLHPSARLTDREQLLIYTWAKAERKRIRAMSPQQ